MRKRLLIPLVGVLATTSASAQTPAARPASAPRISADTVKLGTYDLEVTTDDGTMVGRLVLKPAANGPSAALVVGGHEPDVISFVRDGLSYVLTAGHDQFTVIYTLRFARDSLTGAFRMSGGLSGTVRGSLKR
jgi:hypothetical protein